MLVSATHQHESAIGMHMSPPSWTSLPPSHPSRWSQSIEFELPASYSKFPLTIYFTCTWVSSNEVDEPRAHYTEWSKSEGEEQILYINTYMESRKTVLMNLFTEKKWKHRHREWSGGHSRGRSCFIHCLLWLFCKPTDCSPRGSSVHEISQARILKWVVISSSRGFSWPRDQTHISCVSCPGR